MFSFYVFRVKNPFLVSGNIGKMDSKFAVGKCKTMCPVDEIIMRQKEKLLHVFEMVPGTEKNKIPTADTERAVKMYNRSAAGKSMINENFLRPPEVLLKTLYYLLQNIIKDVRYSWITKYDFIADRMRSIRQDMIIQNISRTYAIRLLEPMVRFYAYSAYRLCEQDIYTFDPHLNKKTLQGCLNDLLILYDQVHELTSPPSCEKDIFDQINISRPFFEALNVILNLGNEEPLLRILHLGTRWRTPIVNTTTLAAIDYLRKNFVKVCRYMKDLTPLLAGVFVLHLPDIRRKTLQIMSVAYSSKNLNFPLIDLEKLLIYESEEDLVNDCKCFRLDTKEKYVQFNKNSFRMAVEKISPKKMTFLDEKFKIFEEPSLLMFGDDQTVQLGMEMRKMLLV